MRQAQLSSSSSRAQAPPLTGCSRRGRPPCTPGPCRAHSSTQTSEGAARISQAVAQQQFGASSTEQQRRDLLRLVSELRELHATAEAATRPAEGPLDGAWQLLWTSEASVHGLVRGQLLGAPVTDIQQCIDLQSKRVTNTISFGWLGLQLQAAGPLRVMNASRIYYSFDELRLWVMQLQLPLPVFFRGGGWTDCVLLLDDGNLRVMENSRKDTLVLRRCV